MKIANLLTLFRLGIIPVIIYLIAQETALASLLALLLFILALISDFLDGYLARLRKETTKVGSFLDLFADKTLIFGTLLFFVWKDTFSGWIFLFFISRDIITTIFRGLSSHDNILIKEKKTSSHLVYQFQLLILFGFLAESYLVNAGLIDSILFVMATLLILFATFGAILIGLISIFYFFITYFRGAAQGRKLGQQLETKNLLILASKKSRGYQNKYRRHLLKVFAKRRNASLAYLPITSSNMFAGNLNLIKNHPHLIIAGGDGSFESALNYKPFWNKALGFFPFGAGNAFYSYFYRGKRFEYLRSRFPFREIELDILELEWEKGKIQTTFLTLGIDSEVIRLSKDRTSFGLYDYVKASLKAAFRAKADYDFQGEIDGKKQELNNCANLVLAKIPYFGYNIRSIPGEVEPDDGLVYGSAVINTHNLFLNKAARLWALILAGLNLQRNPLLPLKGKIITIKSEVPFPLQAGGDFLGYTAWIKVRVVRKQRVLVV